MSAKIETSQHIPCNQQQVMPTTSYEGVPDHQMPVSALTNANRDPYGTAVHRQVADLKAASGKEPDRGHAKYLLDDYMKGNMAAD